MEMIETKTAVGVTPGEFSMLHPRLYHMAHKDAWPAFQRYGLLTTTSIFKQWEVETSERVRIEHQIRKSAIELGQRTRMSILSNSRDAKQSGSRED